MLHQVGVSFDLVVTAIFTTRIKCIKKEERQGEELVKLCPHSLHTPSWSAQDNFTFTFTLVLNAILISQILQLNPQTNCHRQQQHTHCTNSNCHRQQKHTHCTNSNCHRQQQHTHCTDSNCHRQQQHTHCTNYVSEAQQNSFLPGTSSKNVNSVRGIQSS